MRTGASVCLAVLLVLASASDVVAFDTVQITRCGITITVPREWSAGAERSLRDACKFVVDPAGWADIKAKNEFALGEHLLTFTVTKKSFVDAAREAGFMTVNEWRRRQDDPQECPSLEADTWLIQGGSGSRECEAALPIRAASFRGVAGQTSYGRVNQRSGGYAGLGQYSVAAVSDGSIAVEVHEGGELDFDDLFLPIVRSISTSVRRPN